MSKENKASEILNIGDATELSMDELEKFDAGTTSVSEFHVIKTGDKPTP